MLLCECVDYAETTIRVHVTIRLQGTPVDVFTWRVTALTMLMMVLVSRLIKNCVYIGR